MVCAGDLAALDGLVHDASNAFYDLAYCSCRRIAKLSSQPELLAAWALELLLTQASEAVIFVRDLDQSVLGANTMPVPCTCTISFDSILMIIQRNLRHLGAHRSQTTSSTIKLCMCAEDHPPLSA